ncbi:hypothetical protein BT96DRAFT_1014783 [Gymnopus androsaceus JB14]|uniref:Uncharacterized protein n=1 Tax=Gymnopus androsaceus JB14 TaxID=1447944 RepID=A0A6A4IBS6_9AGAR|nr:hypothetical protein BT96DRAFT_1014783 [Gymnopus androsaceus JB14]
MPKAIIQAGPWGKIQHALDVLIQVLSITEDNQEFQEMDDTLRALKWTLTALPLPSAVDAMKVLADIFGLPGFHSVLIEHRKTEYLNMLYHLIRSMQERKTHARLENDTKLVPLWIETETSILIGLSEYLDHCSDFDATALRISQYIGSAICSEHFPMCEPHVTKLPEDEEDLRRNVVSFLLKIAKSSSVRYHLALSVDLLGPKRLAAAMIRAANGNPDYRLSYQASLPFVDTDLFESLILLLNCIRDFPEAFTFDPWKVQTYWNMFAETLELHEELREQLLGRGIPVNMAYTKPRHSE